MERSGKDKEPYQGDSGDETKRDAPLPHAEQSPLHRLNNVPKGEYPEPNG